MNNSHCSKLEITFSINRLINTLNSVKIKEDKRSRCMVYEELNHCDGILDLDRPNYCQLGYFGIVLFYFIYFLFFWFSTQ